MIGLRYCRCGIYSRVHTSLEYSLVSVSETPECFTRAPSPTRVRLYIHTLSTVDMVYLRTAHTGPRQTVAPSKERADHQVSVGRTRTCCTGGRVHNHDPHQSRTPRDRMVRRPMASTGNCPWVNQRPSRPRMCPHTYWTIAPLTTWSTPIPERNRGVRGRPRCWLAGWLAENDEAVRASPAGRCCYGAAPQRQPERRRTGLEMCHGALATW